LRKVKAKVNQYKKKARMQSLPGGGVAPRGEEVQKKGWPEERNLMTTFLGGEGEKEKRSRGKEGEGLGRNLMTREPKKCRLSYH